MQCNQLESELREVGIWIFEIQFCNSLNTIIFMMCQLTIVNFVTFGVDICFQHHHQLRWLPIWNVLLAGVAAAGGAANAALQATGGLLLAAATGQAIYGLAQGCGDKCWHNDWQRRDARARAYKCYDSRWSQKFWLGGRCYCCSCC